MTSENTSSRDRLLLLNRDLMAGIPIVNTAAKLGLKVDRVSTEGELVSGWHRLLCSLRWW